MIILLCPNCYSSKIKIYEGKMTKKGYNWFTCKDCNKNFPLQKTSYRSEYDMFD